MSELFGPIFGVTSVVAVSDDRAWLEALCETEAALARACAGVGLVDVASVRAIEDGCADLARRDPGELGRQAAADGNPVIPLVRALRDRVRERAGDTAAAAVHLGATSQDILDTAMMLIAHRALDVILADLSGCGEIIAQLAGTYRDTPMAGRTLLQQAAPTTFGALAAAWGGGVDGAVARLAGVRDELPAQLGGAAGTLAELHPHGFAVLSALAGDLGLADPGTAWHTDRAVILELAAASGRAGAAIGKIATDIVLLAQSEVGELHEAVPGGSSSMPHKQNPIAAITARAAVAQAPGLLAVLFANAAPELQRGAGSWHAEWPALVAVLRAVGGGAARLRASLTDVRPDTEAMRRNLALIDPGVDTGAVGHAADIVERYLKRRSG